MFELTARDDGSDFQCGFAGDVIDGEIVRESIPCGISGDGPGTGDEGDFNCYAEPGRGIQMTTAVLCPVLGGADRYAEDVCDLPIGEAEAVAEFGEAIHSALRRRAARAAD